MPKPKVLGGKVDQTGHLMRYIKELDHEVESRQTVDKITIDAAVSSES